MDDRIRVLFVDDEQEFLEYTAKRLRLRDLAVTAYLSPTAALAATEGQQFDVALLDLKMPEMDGEALLAELKARDPFLEIVILTGHGTVNSAFRTSRAGAVAFLQKPCAFDDVVRAISEAYARRIAARSANKTERVDALLKRSKGMSPLELLDEIKKIQSER